MCITIINEVKVMSEKQIKPTSKKAIELLDIALQVLNKSGGKAKLTAKQFDLLIQVKVKINGVKKGLVTPDKLLEALNKLNTELKTSFKL